VQTTKLPWRSHSVPHCLADREELVTPTTRTGLVEISGEEVWEIDEIMSDFQFGDVIDVAIMSAERGDVRNEMNSNSFQKTQTL
jgi:hypothetical protein